MKKLFVFTALFALTIASAQKVRFGIKGGLNYGAPGEIFGITSTDFENFDLEDSAGYHAGIFIQAKLLGIGLQPELVYTSLSSKVNGDIKGDYTLNKLDIPVLLSFNVVGPLSIKAGPSFQYLLSNDIDLDTINDIDLEKPENSFTVGFQVGIGLQLGNLGIDARYENAFSDSNALVDASNTNFSVDNRPSQYILSLSYRLGGGAKK